MTTYTIIANDENDRRIRLIPVETEDGRWTYRVVELDGTELDDQPHFAPMETRLECERNIEHIYVDRVWDLRAEPIDLEVELAEAPKGWNQDEENRNFPQ